MSEAWDGRPPGEAAERDGWHQIETPLDAGRPCVAWWQATGPLAGSWRPCWSAGVYSADSAARCGWRYVGPCFTPAEVAAQIAAAVEAEREAIRALIDEADDA